VEEVLGSLRVDHLITVCDDAARRCPSRWPGLDARIHWPIPDPAAVEGTEEERLTAFRAARDRLRARIEAWLAQASVNDGRDPGRATDEREEVRR
jgi:arsenate reductase